jgi:hypothetical protein
LVPQEVAAEVEFDGAGGAQFIGEARKPCVQEPGAGGQQQVRVPALRHLPPRGRVVDERVPVDYDDACEAVCEYACGAEAGHTGSDHHGLVAHNPGVLSCSHLGVAPS